MQRFSFIKGFIIAGVFCSFFWLGAYYAVTSISTTSDQTETIETSIEIEKELEVTATKASL